jgi:hypothetical protein
MLVALGHCRSFAHHPRRRRTRCLGVAMSRGRAWSVSRCMLVEASESLSLVRSLTYLWRSCLSTSAETGIVVANAPNQPCTTSSFFKVVLAMASDFHMARPLGKLACREPICCRGEARFALAAKCGGSSRRLCGFKLCLFAFEILQLSAHSALDLCFRRLATSTDRKYTIRQTGGLPIAQDAGESLYCGASSAAFQSCSASTNITGSIGKGRQHSCCTSQCFDY